jgi:hypothetical protein
MSAMPDGSITFTLEEWEKMQVYEAGLKHHIEVLRTDLAAADAINGDAVNRQAALEKTIGELSARLSGQHLFRELQKRLRELELQHYGHSDFRSQADTGAEHGK